MVTQRYRRRRGVKSEINIVPFLDVLLVLLLIFMATTSVISQSVNVDLPQASQSKIIVATDNTPVILEVSSQGTYSLVIRQKRQEDLSIEQITLQVQQILATDKKAIFLIGGAKDVPYDEIVKAINVLQVAGVESVGLMTHPT